jgi:hypothetical protein
MLPDELTNAKEHETLISGILLVRPLDFVDHWLRSSRQVQASKAPPSWAEDPLDLNLDLPTCISWGSQPCQPCQFFLILTRGS